jgi:hypothetical protein
MMASAGSRHLRALAALTPSALAAVANMPSRNLSKDGY